MLSPEQVQKLKEQLLKQAESLPEENRKLIKHKILSMTDKEIEEFMNQSSEQSEEENKNCIFCAIIAKQSFAYVIADTPKNLAILEINPLSKGHTIVLPKDHTDKEPEKESLALAEEIAKKITIELKPQKVDIFPSNLFGHSFLEIVPSYGEKLEKKKATKEELSEIQSKIKYSESPKKEIVEDKKQKEEPERIEPPIDKKVIIPKIKPRIP